MLAYLSDAVARVVISVISGLPSALLVNSSIATTARSAAAVLLLFCAGSACGRSKRRWGDSWSRRKLLTGC